MDEITNQNLSVSHPASLTCESCLRAGQRVAAGKTTVPGRASDASGVRAGVVAQPCGGPGGPTFPALCQHVLAGTHGLATRALRPSGCYPDHRKSPFLG
jgi:hypothetical protein